jgi:hypothetical protein
MFHATNLPEHYEDAWIHPLGHWDLFLGSGFAMSLPVTLDDHYYADDEGSDGFVLERECCAFLAVVDALEPTARDTFWSLLPQWTQDPWDLLTVAESLS